MQIWNPSNSDTFPVSCLVSSRLFIRIHDRKKCFLKSEIKICGFLRKRLIVYIFETGLTGNLVVPESLGR